MNLFPAPNEKNIEFKNYLSQLKVSAKAIDSSSTTRGFNEQMRQIIEKFPYYTHTNPRIMSVAMTLATSVDPSRPTFDRVKADELLSIVFPNSKTPKDRSALLIDTARYWERLISSS